MMPDRIARLPRDHRGLPIPWNVLRGTDDTPFFIVNDDRRHREALRRGLCPICGEALGRWKWFVGGPRSAFDPHGWYADLPSHHECATFALSTCPYLALPRYQRHVESIANAEKLPPQARILLDKTVDPQRPEIFVAVAASKVEVCDNGVAMLPYVRPMRPALAYEFWRHGQQIPAHRAMPILRGFFGADWELPAVSDA